MTPDEARLLFGLPADEGAHEVPCTDDVEEPFFRFLHAVGLDGHGLLDPKAKTHPFHAADLTATIRTPRFVVRSYDWSDGPDSRLPNFDAFE